MGADFLLSMISHKQDTKPDASKAHEVIDALTEKSIEWSAASDEVSLTDLPAFEELEGDTDAEYLPQIKAILHDMIDGVFAAMDSDREVSAWRIAGYWCYFTGGLSWGDGPTEAFEAFGRVGDCGSLGELVYHAAGFEYVPTDGPFTITEPELP